MNLTLGMMAAIYFGASVIVGIWRRFRGKA